MAKFSVIDGGGGRGPHDFELQFARSHLRAAVVELLRGIARGEDCVGKFLERLNEFIQHSHKTAVPAGQIITDVVSEMHRAIVEPTGVRRDEDIGSLVLECLRLAAEQSTDDGFTKARVSTQQTRIDRLIERYIVDRETRAREHGTSFIDNLMKRHFTRKPVRKRTKAESKRGRDLYKETLDALLKK